MNRWTYQFFTPIFLLLLLLIDSHISQALSALTGYQFMPVSHIFLIALMYSVSKHRQSYLLVMTCLLGIVYDSYFIGVLGIAAAIFPLISLFLYEIQALIFASRWTRLVTTLIIVFAFEVLVPVLEAIFGLVSLNFVHFVTYELAPTLVLNIIFALILQWPLEKLYSISHA